MTDRCRGKGVMTYEWLGLLIFVFLCAAAFRRHKQREVTRNQWHQTGEPSTARRVLEQGGIGEKHGQS